MSWNKPSFQTWLLSCFQTLTKLNLHKQIGSYWWSGMEHVKCWSSQAGIDPQSAQLSPVWIKVKERGNMSGNEDGGRALNGEKSKTRQTAKAELLSRYVFPHTVRLLFPPEPCIVLKESDLIIHRASLSGVSPLVGDFGAQPEKISHHFLSWHTSIQGWNDRSMSAKKEGILGGCVCMRELDGLSLLKVVEVLPRYFIFIVKYSARMVDRGNFCSQPAIQKWKGCGLWMKGAREIDTHGASW